MKPVYLVLIALGCLAAISYADIYEQLEITKDEAKKRLVESIAVGLVQRGDHSNLVSNARNLPVSLRVAGIRELIRFAREYTSTQEFADEYLAWRKNKFNAGEKTKLGLPKLGKILDNKVNNKLDKEKNEKMFPSDPAILVKTRLTEFIALSKEVDFDAQVVNGQFVNQEYKNKNAQWKMCFRAGKEVVEAAREEAEAWLKELNENN